LDLFFGRLHGFFAETMQDYKLPAII